MLTNTASTGLRAAMSTIQVIGNNVANANTTGFKESNVRFADLYSSGVAAAGSEIGIGVRIAGVDQNFSEGSTELTGRNLDLAIRDQGYFILKDENSGLSSYTRAGHFLQDKDGYITAPSGERVQAYAAINNSISANATDLLISKAPLTAQATTKVTYDLNIDSGSSIPGIAFDNTNAASYNYRADGVVYDSLGNLSALSTYFIKTSDNNWDVQIEVDGANLGSGTVAFTSSGGIASTTGLSGIVWSPTTGATTPQLLNIDVATSTQLANPMSTRNVTQDGFSAGTLASFDVDSDGKVTARYSNGKTALIAQVAIAKFDAPQGLVNNGEMMWLETNTSGAPILGTANSNGSIRAGALEQSNTDLTQQLVKLLSAQNNFSANARLVQTGDELNQTIINL